MGTLGPVGLPPGRELSAPSAGVCQGAWPPQGRRLEEEEIPSVISLCGSHTEDPEVSPPGVPHLAAPPGFGKAAGGPPNPQTPGSQGQPLGAFSRHGGSGGQALAFPGAQGAPSRSRPLGPSEKRMTIGAQPGPRAHRQGWGWTRLPGPKAEGAGGIRTPATHSGGGAAGAPETLQGCGPRWEGGLVAGTAPSGSDTPEVPT